MIVVKNYDHIYFVFGEREVFGHSLEVTVTELV